MSAEQLRNPGELPETVTAIDRSFPIMKGLTSYLSERDSLKAVRIGWHCHLTWLTALALGPLVRSGAELVLSECNPDTTEPESVKYMREIGCEVLIGPESPDAVLARRPQIISDTGLVLVSRHAAEGKSELWGACEITTSGIARLRALDRVPLPVVNINDGRLKSMIENFHGVGGELVEAVAQLTGKTFCCRKVAVVGYGRVGSGVAEYLKRSGAVVTVVESNPVLALAAHFDGFLLGSLQQALAESELLVTATGVAGLIGGDEWLAAADGLYVFNVGHWSAEVSPELVYEMALSRKRCSKHLEELTLPGQGAAGSKKVYLAAGGSPANIAVCSGAPEPTLLHLTTEILTLEYLARRARDSQPLPPGEMPVPEVVERQASLLALAALGFHQDR